MSPFRLPLAVAGLAAALLTVAAQPARAEMRVGVREFVSADAASGNAAAGLHDMLFSDLAAMILEAAGKQRCAIVILGISDKMEEGRQLERRLQDEGLIDPSTAVPVKPLEVNTFVDGVVRESADQISWHVDVSGADGTVITRDEGSVPVAERLSVTTKIAERLMSRLCPKKAWHLSARYNDLALDGVICDLSKPFSMRGTGETAGIVFIFHAGGPEGWHLHGWRLGRWRAVVGWRLVHRHRQRRGRQHADCWLVANQDTRRRLRRLGHDSRQADGGPGL